MTATTARARLNAEVRLDESRREAEGLRSELDAWVAERTKRDALGQYHTQIAYIGRALTGALAALEDAIGATDASAPRGEVYRACRALDHRLALVRRTWTYFRTKFAQRDDPRTSEVLAGADELVWSCYAEVLRGATAALPPAPLAFLDAQDTAAAVPRDKPPRELRPDGDDEIVREHLRMLAVPVIGLPFKTVSDPWWVAVAAHEVGHHVQFDLQPDFALVMAYRDALRDAALTALDGDERGAGEWEGWADEVFADACSACSLGGWSLTLVDELEAGSERAMLSRRRTRYPPPVVRLALLRGMVEHVGLGPTPVPEPLEGEQLIEGGRDIRAAAARDIAAVPALAPTACAPPGQRRLAELYGVEPRSFHTAVAYWRDGLLDRVQAIPEPSLRAPRLVAAGALAAWQEVSGEPDAGRREERRAALAERLLELLPGCREEGTRAASNATLADGDEVGLALARTLLGRPLDDDGGDA